MWTAKLRFQTLGPDYTKVLVSGDLCYENYIFRICLLLECHIQ